jgi:hypothetical protein
MGKVAAQGFKFKIGNGADPEIFTQVAHVKDWNFPKISQGTIDTTSCDDEWADAIKDGIKRGGPVAFTLHYDPTKAAQKAVREAVESPDAVNVQLTLADAPEDGDPSLCEFALLFGEWEVTGSSGGVVMVSVTGTVKGQVDFTEAE